MLIYLYKKKREYIKKIKNKESVNDEYVINEYRDLCEHGIIIPQVFHEDLFFSNKGITSIATNLQKLLAAIINEQNEIIKNYTTLFIAFASLIISIISLFIRSGN